jgi:hypothetical protein
MGQICVSIIIITYHFTEMFLEFSLTHIRQKGLSTKMETVLVLAVTAGVYFLF